MKKKSKSKLKFYIVDPKPFKKLKYKIKVDVSNWVGIIGN